MPPWLAQQRNPAMSPHTKGKEQAPVTLTNISGEKPNKPRGRAGGEENGQQNPMKARSGQNHDNKIAPQVNFNPTAANIMDMLCIFVITKQYFFQRVSNYF